MRPTEVIDADVRHHQAVLAYASDLNLQPTALGPRGVTWGAAGLQSASPDHIL